MRYIPSLKMLLALKNTKLNKIKVEIHENDEKNTHKKCNYIISKINLKKENIHVIAKLCDIVDSK